MKDLLKKIFNPQKTKLFWLYFICGGLLLVLSILLMPVWSNVGSWCFWKDWGNKTVDIIIAACIVCYLVFFQIKKLRARANGVIKVLTIIEFILLALIAVGCILQQFKVISVGGTCAILGLAMLARGVIEVFRAYYHQKGNNEKYPIWWLVIAIFFVSFGTYLFAKPLFTDIVVLWIFVILIILVSVLLIIDGVLAKPVAKAKTKSKKVGSKNSSSK